VEKGGKTQSKTKTNSRREGKKDSLKRRSIGQKTASQGKKRKPGKKVKYNTEKGTGPKVGRKTKCGDIQSKEEKSWKTRKGV